MEQLIHCSTKSCSKFSSLYFWKIIFFYDLQVLYQLQDENIVKKTSESPPKWAIVRNQNSETHSHEKQAHITFMKQKEISDVPGTSNRKFIIN